MHVPRFCLRIFQSNEGRAVTRKTAGMAGNVGAADMPADALENKSREVHRMRVTVLCALLAMPVVAWGQESTSSPGGLLILEQAVALALQNNRPVKNASLEVTKAEDGVVATRTLRLPTLDFSLLAAHHLTDESYTFEKGVFGTFPATGPIPAVDTNITTTPGFNTHITASATQPLSQLFGIELDIRQHEVRHEITQEELRAQQQRVVKDVKHEYYRVLQTQSKIEANEEAIKFHRELDRVVAERVKEQKDLEWQSLEVKTRLARGEYEALTLHNTLATQREHLNVLLGRDIRTEFRVSPVPDIPGFEVNLAAAQARAVAQRPEVREARLKVKHAEYDFRIKEYEYFPEVSLTVRYIGNMNVDLLPQNMATVGLYLSWEFFDWGRKKQELDAIGAAVVQATNTLVEAETRVVIDVNTQARKLQEARARLGVSESAQKAAREKLRVTMNQYKEQTALLKDVLEAQTGLAEANNEYQQALLSYWTARADLEKALGEE